jgi:hypothetical protein
MTDKRAYILSEQKELVNALVGNGPLPDGFNHERLQVCKDALVEKRKWAITKAWPLLVQSLGESFDELFAMFVAKVPWSIKGGPLADGREFARILKRTAQLPDAGKIQALAFDLHYTLKDGRFVDRTGPLMAVSLLKRPRRIVIGVRLPWLNIRLFIFPGLK